MTTIYEQIAEAEEKLNLIPEGDDNGDTDNEQPDEGKSENRRVRGQSGHDAGQGSEQGEGEGEGAGDDGVAHEGTPRSKSRTSSEDAGTLERSGRKSRGTRSDSQGTRKNTQGESVGTQENGGASREDGESDDRSVRGRSGQDGRPLEEAEDQPEKPLTNADWARQRRELRELKAKLATLEAGKAIAPASPAAEIKPAAEIVKTAEKSAEPDKNVNYQAWLEWKLEQNDLTIKEQNKVAEDYKTWKAEQAKERETQTAINNAVGEFQSIEENYQQKNPDYLNAMDFARKEYSRALKLTNPQMTQKQIDAKIDYDILAFASQKSQAGLNPAEELYDMAIERFGYTKAEAKQLQEEIEDKPRKPIEKSNLRTISNNKRRSASPLSGGGRGGDVPVTLEVAAQEMTLGEFANLDPQTLAQLEGMGG